MPKKPSTSKSNGQPSSFFSLLQTRQDTYDTYTLELKQENAKTPFSFLPGQFNMLYLPGIGEVPISLSSFSERPGVAIHTIRAVGAVTNSLVKLKAGEQVMVRGPFGNSWPYQKAKGGDVIIMGGGIGLAPLRPLIQTLIKNRTDYRNVIILYGARTPKDLLYEKELKQWQERPDLKVFVTVDQGCDGWCGKVGVVTTLLQGSLASSPVQPSQGMTLEPQNTIAYVCGPEIMFKFCVIELGKLGLASNRIYISMERNMHCGIGLCGHCQCGPKFICKDGPIFEHKEMERLLSVKGL